MEKHFFYTSVIALMTVVGFAACSSDVEDSLEMVTGISNQ